MTLEQANKEIESLRFKIRKTDCEYELISEYNLYYTASLPGLRVTLTKEENERQVSKVLTHVVTMAKYIARTSNN